MSVSNNPSEEKILEDILTIEKHEDRMITALVQLMASSEKMNRRLSLLTWLMLLLTWITFVISIPNTLATIFSIPQVSQALGMEFMTATLIISTIGALLLLILPGSGLSLKNIEKRIQRMSMINEEPSVARKVAPEDSITEEKG